MSETAASQRAPRRRARRGAGCVAALLNVLTTGLLLLTCLSAAIVASLYAYPNLLAFVPGGSQLMAATVPAVAQALARPTTPAPTAALSQVAFPTLPPEWTATQTPTITSTPNPRTPTPEPSATSPLPTRTATRTPTPVHTPTRTPSRTPAGPTPLPTKTRSPFNYTLQPGSPTYLSNFLNNAACGWFGIAGRAFGVDDRPMIALMVKVISAGAELPPVLTGSSPAIGPGGYEVYLGDHPVASTDVYKIQLFSNTGAALSEQYSIRTEGDCTKNLIMVNFVQNH
ncbi:MAG: hypothetical protein IT318_17085 [Anaerolineales bacterium]|nr:hypothetical protein [Anaerolineales bacterium]